MENQETQEKKEEKRIEKVTKQKSPGRVESGKRLAERNRLKRLEAKNKEHKEKIMQQEEPKEPKEEKEIMQEEEAKEKPLEINIYKTSHLIPYLLIGVIGGGIYLYQKYKTNVSAVIQSKTTKEVKSEPEPEKPDPFYME